MVKYRKAPLLSRNAQDYILENCDPLAFIMDVMNGEVTDPVKVNNKVVAKLPPSLDQRMKAAFHLSDKSSPTLRAMEAHVTSQVTQQTTQVNTNINLEEADLDEEDRAALRTILEKRVSREGET